MHKKPRRTGHFVAAQRNKINTQTTWFISFINFASEVIGVCSFTDRQTDRQFIADVYICTLSKLIKNI